MKLEAESLNYWVVVDVLSDEDIELVKSQVDMRMVAEHFNIQVNRKGFAPCVFHNEKTGSMKMYPGKRGYYCFGCGAGGNIFNFVMDYCNMTFEESVRYIVGAFGIRISDGDGLTEEQKRRVQQHIKAAERERKLILVQNQNYKKICAKIQLYEKLRKSAEPFGELFCVVGNRLPLLYGEQEEAFKALCDGKGRA